MTEPTNLLMNPDALQDLLHLRIACTTTATGTFPVPSKPLLALPHHLVESFLAGDHSWHVSTKDVRAALEDWAEYIG
jgi:hypothetical protein